jgi:hypothetical protein
MAFISEVHFSYRFCKFRPNTEGTQLAGRGMYLHVLVAVYGARFWAEIYTRGVPLSFTPLLRLKRAGV